MARGNQRDKAREKNLKEAAKQKKGNGLTGTEFAKAKEDTAAIMRAKQAAGKSR
ncbi:4F5 domain protein, partial [Massarina eburnea CBS 473.64]